MTRSPQLDALRGFALLGIALGNVMWFSGVAVAPSPEPSALDEAVTFGLHLCVDGKFYALFALLFGASFAHMVAGAQRRGNPARALVLRRLASLFVIGALHATLVWFGDILSLYAVAALPLYALARRSARTQLTWAAVLLMTPLGIRLCMLAAASLSTTAPTSDGYGPQTQLQAFATGSYPELLHANAAFLAQRWVLALESGRLPRLLGMFVLGLLWVQHQPTVSPRAHRWLWVIATASNVAFAALAHVPATPATTLGVLRDAIACVAIPTGCLAYVSVLWPFFGRPSRIRAALCAAGRLSLTHYLGQSLIFAALFYGIGLGGWGRLGVVAAVAVGGAVAVFQVLCSRAWVARYGTGPGERLLRAADQRRPHVAPDLPERSPGQPRARLGPADARGASNSRI